VGDSSVSVRELELARIVAETLGRPEVNPAQMDPEADLAMLGVDSLDQIQIVVRIKDRYAVAVPESSLRPGQIFRSLRTLAAFVDEEIRRS
jgi:acyl carrier protein